MTDLRRLLHRRPSLVAFVLGAVLLLKLLVPTGYMPVAAGNGTITIQVCTGMQDAPRVMQMIVPGLPDRAGDHQQPTKSATPCAFSGLAMPMLSGADALLLAVAIAFVMALGSRARALPLPQRPYRLLPPLRGPPATA